jgi:hypothetical protein
MKTLLVPIFAAISLFVSAQEKPEGLFINSKAPDFKAKDQSGLEVTLKVRWWCSFTAETGALTAVKSSKISRIP